MKNTRVHSSLAHYMIMLILLVIGYEWFVSGIDKAVSGVFVSGLHDEMMDAIKSGDPYSFYTGFMKAICLPHCIALGYLVEIGEIVSGAIFILIALVSFIKGSFVSWAAPAGVIASVISVILSLNIFLFTGGKFFFSAEEPFDEGISIDWLMILFSIIFVIYFAAMSRTRKSDY